MGPWAPLSFGHQSRGLELPADTQELHFFNYHMGTVTSPCCIAVGIRLGHACESALCTEGAWSASGPLLPSPHQAGGAHVLFYSTPIQGHCFTVFGERGKAGREGVEEGGGGKHTDVKNTDGLPSGACPNQGPTPHPGMRPDQNRTRGPSACG